MSRNPLPSFLVCLVLGSLLGGCSILPWWDKSEAEDRESSEQVLYQSAQSSMRSGNYSDAIAKLEMLEAQYPFGRYAEQAQLELIYARHMAYQPDAARSAADRFIRLHPQHPNVDYAYYLKGLAAMSKASSMLDRLFAGDFTKRDMTPAREAFADFSQLVNKFPQSEYALDARQRMVYLRNKLAEAEINVARFYMRRGAYVAAANRARTIVEEYSTTPAAEDGLAILVEASYKLGLEGITNDALRVLAINYPTYPAFDPKGRFVMEQNVQNRDRSWTNMVTFGLLDRPKVPPPIAIEYPQQTPRVAPRTSPEKDPAATEDEPVVRAESDAEQDIKHRT